MMTVSTSVVLSPLVQHPADQVRDAGGQAGVEQQPEEVGNGRGGQRLGTDGAAEDRGDQDAGGVEEDAGREQVPGRRARRPALSHRRDDGGCAPPSRSRPARGHGSSCLAGSSANTTPLMPTAIA